MKKALRGRPPFRLSPILSASITISQTRYSIVFHHIPLCSVVFPFSVLVSTLSISATPVSCTRNDGDGPVRFSVEAIKGRPRHFTRNRQKSPPGSSPVRLPSILSTSVIISDYGQFRNIPTLTILFRFCPFCNIFSSISLHPG